MLRQGSLNSEDETKDKAGIWVHCVTALWVSWVQHLAGRPLCDLNQLPEDGVVGALQGLDSYLLWHRALLDARLQQPVTVPK